MLNFQFKALNSWKGVCEFLFEIFFIICEFLNQLCADFAGELRVGHKADFSEYDYAVDVESPFAVFAVAFIVNAEACFIVILDGVDFVTFFCAVEVNLIVFFNVIVRHRKSVRVTVIAEERQNSALFVFQNLFAFSIAYLLFESSHWSEHDSNINQIRIFVIYCAFHYGGIMWLLFAIGSAVFAALTSIRTVVVW